MSFEPNGGSFSYRDETIFQRISTHRSPELVLRPAGERGSSERWTTGFDRPNGSVGLVSEMPSMGPARAHGEGAWSPIHRTGPSRWRPESRLTILSPSGSHVDTDGYGRAAG
jgi:hypothetical protein